MSNYLVTDTDMTSVADAIRTKGGTSASLAFPTGFVNAINDIPSGGGGVEVDTCTINISTMGGSTVWATRIVDNKIVTSVIQPDHSSSYTIQDVVCGSYMRVYTNSYIEVGFSTTGGSSYILSDSYHQGHVIEVTSTPNITDNIYIWDDD